MVIKGKDMSRRREGKGDGKWKVKSLLKTWRWNRGRERKEKLDWKGDMEKRAEGVKRKSRMEGNYWKGKMGRRGKEKKGKARKEGRKRESRRGREIQRNVRKEEEEWKEHKRSRS